MIPVGGLVSSRMLTADEEALMAEIRTRGTGDPRIAAEGTIGFFFEFESGYSVMWVKWFDAAAR